MAQSLRPVRDDMTDFLARLQYGEYVDLEPVPECYRAPLRDYLVKGILPPPALRAVLEARLDAVELFGTDLGGLLAIVQWLRSCVSAVCWGSPDQVQLWCSYARRRACGTALREVREG